MNSKTDRKTEYLNKILLYLIPLLCGMFRVFIRQTNSAGLVLSHIVFILFTAGVFDTFLHFRQGYFYEKIHNKALFWIAYAVSFFFMGIDGLAPVGVMWLFLIVVTALDAGMEVSISCYVYLMIQYVIMVLSADKDIYRFLLYLLMGIVLALLFSQLEQKQILIYLSVILIASDLTLQFAIRQFDWTAMKSDWFAAVVEVVSLLIMVLTGYLYLRHYTEKEKDIQLKMLCLLEPDSDLLMRMETYSMALLSHSMKISMLSEGAAKTIGANELLAKTGGMYHEVGRISDEKNYIEEGIALGKKANFPDCLLDVMRQHSTGYELPKSAEAAIVMLTDCIVSTSDYLNKSGKGKKITKEQLVASIFKNRIEKDNLAESGLTDEQLMTLKNYYIQNAFTEE